MQIVRFTCTIVYYITVNSWVEILEPDYIDVLYKMLICTCLPWYCWLWSLVWHGASTTD